MGVAPDRERVSVPVLAHNMGAGSVKGTTYTLTFVIASPAQVSYHQFSSVDIVTCDFLWLTFASFRVFDILSISQWELGSMGQLGQLQQDVQCRADEALQDM